VLIMRKQDGMDGADIRLTDRRAARLDQDPGADLVVTWRIEGGIGQQSQAANLDDHCRAADKLNVDGLPMV